MMRAMFAAISGLKSHQVMLDVTANDISNVNTVGYKAARMNFRDELAQLSRGGAAPGAGQGGTNAVQIGLGTQVGSVDNQMTGGSLQTTGNPLDVAISGSGWFRVGSSTAPAVPTTIEYTRAGNFTTNNVGYLMTQDGQYVIGKAPLANGAPSTTDTLVLIPPGSSNVSIGQDGSVTHIPPGGGAKVTAAYLSLAKFANEAALERQGDNLWVAGPDAGAEQVSTPGGSYGATVGGALEMSNVDLAAEFTSMITAERGFEANSRTITTADQMLQTLVNLIH
jgi:flagellar hook protein FlgE